jgi:hypothetical protein
MTTLPPSVSQLSGQCGVLNISQPYRPPQPITGIALLFLMSPSSLWQNGPSTDDRSNGYSGTLATFYKTTTLILEDRNLRFHLLESLNLTRFQLKFVTCKRPFAQSYNVHAILMSIQLSACREVPLTGSWRFLSCKHFATVGWISCQTSAIYKHKLIIYKI